VTSVTPARSTVVSATHEPLCKLAFRCKLANIGLGDKMDHFISKTWPNRIRDFSEYSVMLSVLVVVVVSLLRILLNVG
jgi:hypothetical protein